VHIVRSTPVYTGDQVHLPVAQRGPTVYIGHLTPDTDDVIIRQLLQVVKSSKKKKPYYVH
jgi:hypothetical protein